MIRRIFALLWTLLLLCAAAGAEQGDAVFPIASSTASSSYTTLYSSSFSTTTLYYNERGLVTSIVESTSGTDPLTRNFFYTYDRLGNPKAVSVARAEDTEGVEAVTFQILNGYEGERVTSVTVEGLDISTVYTVLGSFSGYRDAVFTASNGTYQNRDGRPVSSRVEENGLTHSAAYAWENGRLTRQETLTERNGRLISRLEITFDSVGCPTGAATALLVNGTDTVAGSQRIAYTRTVDAYGAPCLQGHPDAATLSGELSYPFSGAVWQCYLREDGTVRVWSYRGENAGMICEYDARGNIVRLTETDRDSETVTFYSYQYR